MQRIAVTLFAGLCVGLLFVGSAWAGSDATSATPLLAPTPTPTTLFGYAGPRPLVADTPSGIARTTPPPRLETAAFGAATDCLPAKPRMVTPTPAPTVAVASDTRRRIVVREYAGGTCSPCAPCDPCCPTSRVNDDPLSISPHQWSSGYHDGAEVQFCDPCQSPCSQPVYRAPCEPCVEPCDPCTVVVRRPVRVVRRVSTPACGPCFTPCRTWCGPRLRLAVSPCWGWGVGWGWGLGWGWGGCW